MTSMKAIQAPVINILSCSQTKAITSHLQCYRYHYRFKKFTAPLHTTEGGGGGGETDSLGTPFMYIFLNSIIPYS